MIDGRSSGMVREVVEDDPSVAGRLAWLGARRLAAAGVPVQLRVWPGQMHVFQIATPMVPEADRSLRQIGNYIREATDPQHRVAVCTARARAPRSRRRVIADSASNRLPPSVIHRRNGDS